ncbi:hypothetical protein XELAEV_18020048mg [Xenopus laevis]|uniref:Uncharacterized protein n=1 Tax=Xenopus laevis TaxID=8355 RepID=A0A974D8Z8_XENLA|nr:hypothetical protein XELAEV_18020048mg [Xenopus laevis]
MQDCWGRAALSVALGVTSHTAQSVSLWHLGYEHAVRCIYTQTCLHGITSGQSHSAGISNPAFFGKTC